MSPGKKFSKKQMREDKLVTTAFKASEYVQKNPTPFIIGGVVVAILFTAILLYTWNSGKKLNESVTLLARARLSLEAGQSESAVADLEDLVLNYSGTEAAGNGAMLMANYNFQTENYEDALKYFLIVIRDYNDHGLRLASATSGAAACYDINGDKLEAARYYQMSAEAYPEDMWGPDQLKQAVNCYLGAGDTAMAITVINNLDSLYQTSAAAMSAKKTLAEITY